MRSHAKRCREHRRCGFLGRVRGRSETVFERGGLGPINVRIHGAHHRFYPAGFRHGFEVYRPIAIIPARKVGFPAIFLSHEIPIHTSAPKHIILPSERRCPLSPQAPTLGPPVTVRVRAEAACLPTPIAIYDARSILLNWWCAFTQALHVRVLVMMWRCHFVVQAVGGARARLST